MAFISVGLTFTSECLHCGNPLPVNQASEITVCSRCWNEIPTPANFWQLFVAKRLREACAMEPETDTWATGIIAGLGNYRLTFGNLLPRCGECGAFLSLESLLSLACEQGGNAKFSCSSCGAVSCVRVPPAWFSRISPQAFLFVGETFPDAGGGLAGTGEGISIRCYHCGGPLSIDGSSRAVKCVHCSQDLLVPDDVWMRLHPAVSAHTWYIFISTDGVTEQFPEDIEEFQDLAALPDGDMALLWKEDPGWRLGRADRNGGLRWIRKDITAGDYSRMLYSQAENLLWVFDREEDIIQSFSADKGETVTVIKKKKNKPEFITAINHEGIAASSDGTLLVHRCWEDDNYALRRFDSSGKRIQLWPGTMDDELSRKRVDWEELKDRPARPPDAAWITCSSDGTLYFIDRKSGRYASFDSDGVFRGIVEPHCRDIEKIQDCGVSGDGSVYILFDHKETIGDLNFSHVGKINPDGTFHILAGPHAEKNSTSLGTDLERMSVSESGEIHICDRGFDNFRILSPDGMQVWRSPATEKEDENRAEELAEARES